MKLLCAILLSLSSLHLSASSAPPLGIKVPITFGADSLPNAGTNDIVLPVYPVGILVTDQTAEHLGTKSEGVVMRTCELLRAILKRDIEAFKKLMVATEGQGITDPEMFFDYLRGLYYSGDGYPVIIAYSKDKTDHCVWVTTSKNPSRLYAIILEGPDMKWNLMTQGGQFNVVHDFLKDTDLAAAINQGGFALQSKDGIFDFKSQLPLDLQKPNTLNPLLERIKSHTSKLAAEVQRSTGANGPKARLLEDALSALSTAEVACSIGNVIAVIGKAQNGETSLFYFEKDGDSFKPILTQTFGVLGTFLIESYNQSKADQQAHVDNDSD